MRTTNHLWLPSPAILALSSGNVHVWRASLDQSEAWIESLRHILAVDEVRRAERFLFQKDREQFVIARGLLRLILSRYIHTRPDRLHFSYNAYGKPVLDKAYHSDVLRFNLSHAHGLVLYAIARDREIGVDLEWTRRDLAWEEIAQRFFSPHEYVAMRALPAKARREGFFNCWTRKEAYVKARGEGLLLPLHQFDVSLIPGEPALLLKTRDDRQASWWSLHELYPGTDYVAALAVSGHDWSLSCWQYLEWIQD